MSIGVTATALLDPLSTVAQKLAPMLELLRSALNVGVKVMTRVCVGLSASPAQKSKYFCQGEAPRDWHDVHEQTLSTHCPLSLCTNKPLTVKDDSSPNRWYCISGSS
jgi:hypothetical protein